MKKRAALGVCLFVVFLWNVGMAQAAENTGIQVPDAWYREEFPNPQVEEDTYLCGRGKLSFICDPNHVLDPKEANQLDQVIEDIHKETKCPCSQYVCDRDQRGYQISIALVKKMLPHPRNVPVVTDPTTTPHHKTEDEREKERIGALFDTLAEAEKFTAELLRRWQFGKCEDHIVVLYSVQDNVVYTMTGLEARKKLSEKDVSEIQQNARNHLAPGRDIMGGLREIIMNYRRALEGNYQSRIIYDKPETGELRSGSQHTQFTITSIVATVISVLVAMLQ